MSEVTQTEKQIIHLMLHHREAVAAVAESAVRLDHFNPHNQLLAESLFEAESKNAALTRLSFEAFLERRHIGKTDQIAARALFNECRNAVVGVKMDDLPSLLEKKRQSYVAERTFQYLQEFQKNTEKDPTFAAKQLVESLGATLDE